MSKYSEFLNSIPAIIITTVIFFAVVFCNAYAEEIPPVDIVFLLDTRDAMNTADPDRAAISALTQFVRSVGAGETRIGVVGTTRQIPLRRLENNYVIAGLTASVSIFENLHTGLSLSAAFSAAANMLEESENALIIVISHEATSFAAEGISVHSVTVTSNSGAAELAGRFMGIYNAHRVELITPEPEPTPTPEPVQAEEMEDEIEDEYAPEDEDFPEEAEIEESFEEVEEELEEELEEESEEEIEESYEEAEEESEEEIEEEIDEESDEKLEEEELEEEEAESEPTYTLLFSVAILAGLAAAVSVFRFIKEVIS